MPTKHPFCFFHQIFTSICLLLFSQRSQFYPLHIWKLPKISSWSKKAFNVIATNDELKSNWWNNVENCAYCDLLRAVHLYSKKVFFSLTKPFAFSLFNFFPFFFFDKHFVNVSWLLHFTKYLFLRHFLFVFLSISYAHWIYLY